jgi:hypothetical protein
MVGRPPPGRRHFGLRWHGEQSLALVRIHDISGRSDDDNAVTHSRRYGVIARYFRDDAVCHLCGKPVSAEQYGHFSDFGEQTVTLDHITPQGHGGEILDVKPAHLMCNSFRGAAPVDVARVLLRDGRPPEKLVRLADALAYPSRSIAEIAEDLGVAERDVAEVIYTSTQSASMADSSERYSDDDARRAQAMKAGGATYREIGTALGRSKKSVEKHLRRTRTITP